MFSSTPTSFSLRPNPPEPFADSSRKSKRAARNLEQKFPSALPDFENRLRAISRLTSPPALTAPSLALVLPEKDRPVLASAIQHQCDALITGDKTHFGRLYGQTISGVCIHSPQSLAEVLLGATGAKTDVI
ncbi:MAG: hypothetical protein EBY32_01860 [Proteobacteria bacterium]|nr:hypothetical protein [Pseudomonadota bacterium]